MYSNIALVHIFAVIYICYNSHIVFIVTHTHKTVASSTAVQYYHILYNCTTGNGTNKTTGIL